MNQGFKQLKGVRVLLSLPPRDTKGIELSPELKEKVIHHATKNFSVSDAVMSRCISTAVSLLWTEEQIKEKGEKIVAAVKKFI